MTASTPIIAPPKRRVSLPALVREPLLQFLAIGLGLFLLYGLVSQGDSNSRRIVISQGQADALALQHQSVWNRPPTRAELQSLIDVYIRDEILYREGVALGLDQDDAVIKRRVRQKFELIAEEENRSVPTDDDLLAYMKTRPDAFVEPPVVTFDQVYFDPKIASPEDVAAAKAALQGGGNTASVGQPSMLPRLFNNSSLELVERDFGKGFAEKIASAPLNDWVGPVASGIGVHVVRVRARSTPKFPPLEKVRNAVAREWERSQRERAKQEGFQKLRSQYDVVVEAQLPPLAK